MKIVSGKSRFSTWRWAGATRSWFAQTVLTSMTADCRTHDFGHDGRWQCAPAPLLVRILQRRNEKPVLVSLAGAAGLVALCLFVLWPESCRAQGRCAEGRTASGQCVNASLAGDARKTAIIFSQPEISQTAFPILPSGDATYRYPNALIPNPLKPAPTGIPAPN